MKNSMKHLVVTGAALSFFAACSAEESGSGRMRLAGSAAEMAKVADAVSSGWLPVSVGVVEEGEQESLNLVKASLEKYTAKLSGGVDCWGDLPEVFKANVGVKSETLKVRQDAEGCSVTFTELQFKGSSDKYTSTKGLLAAAKNSGVFTSSSSSVIVQVIAGLNTKQEEPIKLTAEFATLDTIGEKSIVDVEVSAELESDAVASPNVKVTKVGAFNNKLIVDFECANSGSTNSACKPTIGGSSVESQPLLGMRAKIIQVTGKATVAETLGQLTYSTLKGAYDAASGEQLASDISGIKAKFNKLPFVQPSSGKRLVLVIAFTESIGSSKGTGYKAFLLK